MKLHKINKEGTLAVVIPKDMADALNWKEGHDIIVNSTDDDTVIKLVNKTLRQG